MPTVFPERLHVNGRWYAIDAYPLEPYLAGLVTRPRLLTTPFSSTGYAADWAIDEDVLYMAHLHVDMRQHLFPGQSGCVAAWWYTGLIRAWHGNARYTGFPPRRFFNQELVVEVIAGRIQRQWQLDLRHVPNQSSDELRRSLPDFLLRRQRMNTALGPE